MRPHYLSLSWHCLKCCALTSVLLPTCIVLELTQKAGSSSTVESPMDRKLTRSHILNSSAFKKGGWNPFFFLSFSSVFSEVCYPNCSYKLFWKPKQKMTWILSLENSFFCFPTVAGCLMHCIFATFLSMVQTHYSSVTKKYFLRYIYLVGALR